MPASVKRSPSVVVLLLTVAFLLAAEPGLGSQEPRSEKRGQVKADDPKTESSSLEAPLRVPDNAWTRVSRTIASDQARLWTSPRHWKVADAEWLVPSAAFAGGFFAANRNASPRLARNPAGRGTIARAGTIGLAGAAGGMYLWSLRTRDSHQRETALLAGESVVDSVLVSQALVAATGRNRSSASLDSAAAWSIAGIVAHEYPGPLTKLLAYGTASAVSFSRTASRDHFAADVIAGSSIGWLIARSVYLRGHDPALGGGEWRSLASAVREKTAGPGRTGTTYVPLDSWVYPSIERLAALGLADQAFLATRPWTRLECAQLVEDAALRLGEPGSAGAEAAGLIEALEKEFEDVRRVLAGESAAPFRLNSVYTRATGIAGDPLADSEHFGQTFVNDSGRPSRQGFNNVTGFSGTGTYGIFSVYVQGEYQHSPAAPAYPLAARAAIAASDAVPVAPAVPFSEVDRFRLLEAYVGVHLENWQFSFGKQSLWWGPGADSALMFSNNAEPIYMFRGSRVAPIALPWVLRRLGPVKLDFFFGKLSGHAIVPRPLIHGERLSFKPTPNLEFGFSRTAVFGGVGRPLTLGAIWNSYASYTSSVGYADNVNPGKRNGGFDFSYRVPYLRDWLTIYADSISDDDPSPLAAPRRAGIVPGLYLARVPKVPKLDLRFEAGYTDPHTSRSIGGRFIYWDAFYHDFYSNKEHILGSWIGREGQGFTASSTYWFRPRTTLSVSFRHAKIDGDFLPGGGSQTDFGAAWEQPVSRSLVLGARLEGERWNIPVLDPRPQSNVSVSLEVTYVPRARPR
jgi:Capsule assembly protein Wzi/PAP2 superfamily